MKGNDGNFMTQRIFRLYIDCFIKLPASDLLYLIVVIEGIFGDRKSTRLNSSPRKYLVCRLRLEKKK